MIDDSALGSHLSIPAKCSSLHDVCFILATFHLQKNQAICWKQKEDLLGTLPKCKARILIEDIFFLPGVRDGECVSESKSRYMCVIMGEGHFLVLHWDSMCTASPAHTCMCLSPCPTLSIMPIWLGQTPTPEHRSDCFRIRYVYKMSKAPSASPLCQGSCGSISQSEDNKFFCERKKKSTQNVLVHYPLYAFCQNPKIQSLFEL